MTDITMTSIEIPGIGEMAAITCTVAEAYDIREAGRPFFFSMVGTVSGESGVRVYVRQTYSEMMRNRKAVREMGHAFWRRGVDGGLTLEWTDKARDFSIQP